MGGGQKGPQCCPSVPRHGASSPSLGSLQQGRAVRVGTTSIQTGGEGSKRAAPGLSAAVCACWPHYTNPIKDEGKTPAQASEETRPGTASRLGQRGHRLAPWGTAHLPSPLHAFLGARVLDSSPRWLVECGCVAAWPLLTSRGDRRAVVVRWRGPAPWLLPSWCLWTATCPFAVGHIAPSPLLLHVPPFPRPCGTPVPMNGMSGCPGHASARH